MDEQPRAAARPVLGIPPPAVFVPVLVAGLALQSAVPTKIVRRGWLRGVVGLPLVLLGGALVAWALRTFHEADTDDRFARPTSEVVDRGPYRHTRNPMYLGVSTMMSGAAFLANSRWLLAALPALVAYFQFGVIRREERYLERWFGAEYVGYKARVRRWL